MSIIKIRNKQTGTILYSGLFGNIKECVEYAVSRNVDLSGANLSYQNLSNAQLDGALLKGTDFQGANLTGANLSEAILDGARFNNACLYNTFLCESSLKNCDFTDASFGATDIYGSDLSFSRFSTLTTFTLSFTEARNIQSCIYQTTEGRTIQVERPPLCLKGLAYPLFILGHDVLIGSQALEYKALQAAYQTKYYDQLFTPYDAERCAFIENHIELILKLGSSPHDKAIKIRSAVNS